MTLGYGEDIRDYLLDPSEHSPRYRPKCPVLEIKIEGEKISALIDTGSEVSAISEKIYLTHEPTLINCPTLPLTGVTVTGAINSKATKVNKQIFAKIDLDQISEYATLLIIPHLTADCILGVDFLGKLKAKIDMDTYTLQWSGSGEKTESHKMKFTNSPDPALSPQNQIKMIECQDYSITLEAIHRKILETNWSTPGQAEALEKLLIKHRREFDTKPGLLNSYEHELQIAPHNTFQAKTYPVSVAYRDSVDQEIEKMLKLKIIQKSTSPYRSPLVVVPKKDGTVRLCLDAKKINEIMLPDNEQMETPEVLFQQCIGVKYMSSLDLRSSFWQIPLSEQSRKYTAFSHRGRCYEFCVTPFGLRTSTASLVRGLGPILKGLDNTINFVDDLLCMSEDFDQHLDNLDELFTRFEKHGLTLNLEKSQFLRSKVTFLGHILTTEGIRPDPEKIRAIKEFPAPRTVKQLRGFLGLINFYSKFTKEHAAATYPLLPLIKKNSKWRWGNEEETAFREIKEKFCSNVVLHYPDRQRPFYVQTDASDFALGAVLYQINGKNEHEVLQFASRTLKGAELAYYTTEKELLAIVWSLQKFRSYLLGSKIHVITDHAALLFLKECKLAHARLTRWSLAIQDYDITIEHCEGKKNHVADVLSRLPDLDKASGRNSLRIARLVGEISPEFEKLLASLDRIQTEDTEINTLKTLVEKEEAPTGYSIHHNILYKEIRGCLRAVIPVSMASKIIAECHEIYGHAGSRKCYLLMCEDFYCPHMYRITRQQIACCESCQKNKINVQGSYAEMQNILPTRPGELVSLDFYGPLPAGKYGMKYILAVIDVFSKLTRLYPLRKTTTDATLRCIISDYIPKYGRPQMILSDQGTQFTSPKWRQKLEEEDIRCILTSIRHPQANPVERTNRELSRFFRTFLKTEHNQWVNWIEVIEGCINETYHESTGFIPMHLHTGLKPKKPWEHIIEGHGKVQRNHEELIFLAQENMKRRRKKQSDKFNREHRMSIYSEGQLVLVKALNVSNPAAKQIAKFMPLYEGPYRVKKRVGKASYLLEFIREPRERGFFHTHNLRPFHNNIKYTESTKTNT